jgi:hypothetical protein
VAVDAACASTSRARARDGEEALGEADLPLAAASPAGLGRRAGFLAGAAANLAGLVAGNLELALEPVRGLLEGDLEPVLEIFAAPGARSARAAPAAEEPLEEILDDGAEADVAGTVPKRS